MTLARTQETARAFLHDYSDPGVDKRLWFEVWSDRAGLSDAEKGAVWRMVIRFTRHEAGRKSHRTRVAGLAGVVHAPCRVAPGR